MKKTLTFIMLSLAIISLMGIGLVSAGIDTYIGGIIFNADYTQRISGANVTVECNEYNEYTTSSVNGTYSVIFSEGVCPNGSVATVIAEKDGQYGSASGIVGATASYDFAIINVPLVPEFGLIAGMATIFGAIGVFFFVRRE